VLDQASVSLLFRGPTPEASRPQHPILSKLHLQPAVDLIPTYTKELREELGIGTASRCSFCDQPTSNRVSSLP
jgi:hypothetical protein